MYLIRRKSDGLYFGNEGYHGRYTRRANGKEWHSDPNMCRPFKSIAGLKSSYGANIPIPPHKWDEFKANGWSWNGIEKDWPKFDDLFEIVPVVIQTITQFKGAPLQVYKSK